MAVEKNAPWIIGTDKDKAPVSKFPIAFASPNSRKITGRSFVLCGDTRVQMDFTLGVTVALNEEQLALCELAVESKHLVKR